MASRYLPGLLGLALLSAHPARAAEPPSQAISANVLMWDFFNRP